MTSSPVVNVVIPCFNTARFIRETLASVFSQKAVGIEVIAVDDGSTDETLSILREYGDRVRVECSNHAGAAAARQKGVELARGRFIQYVDSDDLLEPGEIARRVAALEKSDADIAYSDWRRLVEEPDGRFAAGEVVARSIEDVHARADIATFTDFWAPPVALLYRRTLVERLRWNLDLPVIQDARYLFDAARAGARFVRVPGVGAYYRTRRGSLSSRDGAAFLRDILRNAISVEALWRAEGSLDADRHRALLRAYGHVTRASFGCDETTFGSALERLRSVDPRHVPGPFHFRATARLFGYRNAERCSRWLRHAKHAIRAGGAV